MTQQKTCRPNRRAGTRSARLAASATTSIGRLIWHDQARIWSLREAALGLSMAMKEDAKSISFVEDTAVAPERLRDYIERFLGIVRKHDTTAGHLRACLRRMPACAARGQFEDRTRACANFEAIANDVADLVLEFGGALVRRTRRRAGAQPVHAQDVRPEVCTRRFGTIKRTFDPHGILNPGKIVDSPPLTANLRFGAGYKTPVPPT